METMFIAVVDGTRHPVAPAGLGDLVALERRFNISSAHLQELQRIEHMAFIAFHQLTKRGEIAFGDFDEFLDHLDAIEPVEDASTEKAVDPSDEAAQPA